MHLPLPNPWAWALGTCVVAAALEGILSGRGIKRRLSELRQPRPAPPLWVWSIIGIAYYLLFFFVLTSILGSVATPAWTVAGLALVALLLVANASWSWLFFRKKDLRRSVILFVPYTLAAVALALVLARLRNPLFPWFLLYLGYLAYGTWWGHRVWRLNKPADDTLSMSRSR